MAKQTTKTEQSKAPSDDGRTEYTVTDRAPGRINGKRVKAGTKLKLTEDEARGELLAGHLVPATPAAASKPD